MASEGSAMSDAQNRHERLTDLVTTPAFDRESPSAAQGTGTSTAALGYEGAGQRAEAEFYLGLALAELPYDMVVRPACRTDVLINLSNSVGTAQEKTT